MLFSDSSYWEFPKHPSFTLFLHWYINPYLIIKYKGIKYEVINDLIIKVMQQQRRRVQKYNIIGYFIKIYIDNK